MRRKSALRKREFPRALGALIGLLLLVGVSPASASQRSPAQWPVYTEKLDCASVLLCSPTTEVLSGGTAGEASPLDIAPWAAATLADFTWSGGAAPGAAGWSNTSNWVGGVAPSVSVGTLSFPALTSAACTASPATATCLSSTNDVTGVNATALSIDDGERYSINGNGLSLGPGGLTAAPSAADSGGIPPLFSVPIALTAAQTWSITGGSLNQQLAVAAVTGPTRALTINLNARTFLELLADAEV